MGGRVLPPPAARIIRTFREPVWLTEDRVRAVCGLGASAFAGAAAVLLAIGGGRDPWIGFDFASFWSASVLLLEGRPLAVYDTQAHFAVQLRHFDGVVPGWSAFFYPPVYLLVCAPLAVLPYGIALILWVVATTAALAAGVVRMAGRAAIVPVLAFPAIWVNAGFGQNGALSAALLAWGAWLIDRRPVLAGICFGSLCYKPQIALAVPVALLAARRWRVSAAACTTVIAWAAVATFAFGRDIWAAFLRQAPIAREGLEAGEAGFEKIVSIFAAARMLGLPPATAYAVHGAMAALAAAALIALTWRRPGGLAEGATICAATLFLSPFLLVYDLAIVVLPMAWFVLRLRADGKTLPWEVIGLVLLGFTPLLAWSLTRLLGVQAAPLVALLLFVLVARRLHVEARRRLA
nr:glycosyltransferase family 87 protein [Neoroseomonas marina]